MPENLEQTVADLMKSNRRTEDGHTYTIPSPELYPFQWLWDSCFHAIIYSHFDPEQARAEIRSVIAKPLPSGLLPHIIYWVEDYAQTTWGREIRGDIITEAMGTIGTSCLTQPPIIAEAVLQLHRRAPDSDFLNEVYPSLKSFYLALREDRALDETELLGIINPDESGEDNSPRFDEAQHLPHLHTPEENLDRRIERMEQNKKCNFDAKECMRHHFWIEDVSFNCIYVKGLKALAVIAAELGKNEDAESFRSTAKKVTDAILEHMCADGVCYSLQDPNRDKIEVNTWNVFVPLYAGILSQAEADNLVNNFLLNTELFKTDHGVPSTALSEPAHTTDDFWRGPTWMSINWFIYHGLKNYGYDDLAAELKVTCLSLIAQSGFREYYDTKTGEGIGAHDFTWGTLVIDMN